MPRLELNATVTGVKLFNLIIQEIDLLIEWVKFWSDSMLTLQYIQDQSHRFKVYVANRVSQILESTSSNYLNFIEEVKNPADICSRGVFHPMQLLETNKHGQNWLSRLKFLCGSNKMCNTKTIKTLDETNPEIRKAQTFVAINVVKENKYANWPKIIRIMDWVLRIASISKQENQKKRGEQA